MTTCWLDCLSRTRAILPRRLNCGRSLRIGVSDIVYYNWELTSLRVHQWRLFAEIMPLLAPVSGHNSPVQTDKKTPPPYVAVENWLAGMEFALGNTVTEVTRTAPDELTVTRSAPLVFTGLELVWLSYWLADVPGAPVNMDLMQKAKITGPGMPH